MFAPTNIISHRLPKGPAQQTPRGVIVHAHGETIEINQDVIDHYGPEIGSLGEIVDAVDWLERLGLSAHAIVPPDASLIRCRRDTEGAWHAKGWNTDTLGIEILVPDAPTYGAFLRRVGEPWTNLPQLRTAAWQVAHWCNDYPIEWTRRHCDVDPDRKVDPGVGFPWEQFNDMVARMREEV